FTTMQTAPDPADKNRVVVGAGAKSLFATIADDKSLTTASGKKSAAASATKKPGASAVPASRVAVTVENGTGITGRASVIAAALTGKGFSPETTTTNAPVSATTTTLTYGTGQKGEARTAAKALGLSVSHLKQGTSPGLVLVVGADWPSGTTYPGGSSASASDDGKNAVADAHASTADEAKTCATVSPYRTVSLNGVPMTPAQAYAAARDKPDSDE
ncbi:LytR C-terminal domain-containing protein, partial [Streptomyces sp. NPDC004579]|uniref:LytR C-terminal domain-containing protein n=1 Tax=Streptomyces sp. NPDC004579 TaxID=3154667 RepID=UPI0033AA9E2A